MLVFVFNNENGTTAVISKVLYKENSNVATYFKMSVYKRTCQGLIERIYWLIFWNQQTSEPKSSCDYFSIRSLNKIMSKF